MAKYELVVTSDDALSSPLTLTVLNSVGPRGLTGPQGPQGETGPQGPAGVSSLADLSDVDGADTATAGQLLQADGDDTFSFVTVAGATNTLDDVTDNGNTTTNSISVGGVTATSLNTHTIPGGTGTLALTSDIPTVDLDDVTSNGNTTTNAISVGGITATSLNTHTIPSGTGTLAKTSDIPTNNNQLTNGAGYITDYTVTQGDVTAHQAALSITESQISDLGTYLTTETNDLGAAVTWANVPDANITESSVTQHQAALSITESQISDFGTYIPTSQKGAAGGVASLDGSGLVPTNQLPSYVDDVLEYTNYTSFPASGETGKIYVDLATGDIYRWSGSAYVQINNAVSSADQATQLATARTISLGGDVSGSTSFDGTADVTITATVADDSHNHIISNVDGLQSALDAKINTADLADTDALTEGTTNLYYTDARSRQAISLSSSSSELSYNNTTGVFSYTSPTTVAETNAVTIEVRNTTGSTIAKGVPVYVSGHSGQDILVAPADADDANKMPAIGLMAADLNNNSNGTVTSMGLITGIDLSGFSTGDILYVDTTPGGSTFGGLTNTKPTGESSKVQNLGKVANASVAGEFIISNPGRSNDTPNLDNGDIFIGNASNQAVTSSLSTEVSSIVGSLSLNADNIGSGTLASARLPDLAVSDFAASAIVTEAEGLNSSDNDTSIPTTAAVKDYVDGTGSVANDTTITIAGGTGLTTGGDFTTNQGAPETITINHSNSVTAGTVSEGGAARTLSYGDAFNVPSVTYDAQGHITGTTTTALTLPASDNTDTLPNDATITISAGTGLSDGGTFTTDQGSNGTITLNHTNSVTGATVSEGGATRTLSYGDTFNVPTFTFDNQGHISGTGTAVTLTLPASDNTDTIYSAGDGLDLNGTTFSHTDTSTASSLTTLSGAAVVSDIDVDTYGHVTAMATRSLTLADLGYTGSTSADNYASWTVSDGTNSEAIASGNTLTFADSGASSVSYDTSTNTLTVSSTDTNTTYSAGTGLGLSGTEFSLDFSELTDMTGAISGTTEFILQDSGTESRKAASEISLSAFDNSTSGFTTNTGTVTNVSGGNGLTGSVTSSGSLNVGAGNYIVVNADDIAVDATSANTGGKVVARDANGDFQARNLTLSGNLTVNGLTTTLDTTNLTVEDRLIELATGATGTPSSDSGIVIERGDSNNAFIGFDESEGRFTVGTGTFDGSSTGDLTITTGTLAANLVGDVTGTVSDVSNHNSDDITEGSSNLYTTAARTRGHFTYGTGISHDGSGGLSVTQADINTDNVTEGSSNLFTTAARTRGHFTYGTGISHDGSGGLSVTQADINTDNITEGSSNLFTTAARTRGHFSYGTGIAHDGSGQLSLDFSELADKTTDITGTTEFILQDSGTESRKAASEIKLSAFDNDAGFTSNVGDITGVTAGTGLSGGGDSGSVTLNLDFSELTDMTGNISGTTEFILQNGVTESRKAANEIGLSHFNNDAGFTTNTGTVTSVGGGSGLSGTVTSSGNLNVNLGDDTIFTDAGAASRAVKTNSSGYITGTRVFAGASGVGRVSMNYNDGGGHANVTFNHDNRIPDLSGNSGRIVVNTDTSGSAQMEFELASAVTAGTLTTTTPYMTLYETGIDVVGVITDSKGDVRKITQNPKTAAYTLVAADAGKHISTNSAVTIPNGVFSTGDAITIFNSTSSTINITAGTGITLHEAGTTNTGSRQLGSYGLCTVLCFGDGATDQFVISGVGLS